MPLSIPATPPEAMPQQTTRTRRQEKTAANPMLGRRCLRRASRRRTLEAPFAAVPCAIRRENGTRGHLCHNYSCTFLLLIYDAKIACLVRNRVAKKYACGINGGINRRILFRVRRRYCRRFFPIRAVRRLCRAGGGVVADRNG